MAGEGGAAAVLQALVQNLINLSTNQISHIRGLKKGAQKLILNLSTIQQFLNDAEARTITSGAVKSWLQRLQNAAFEADDVLDELHYHSLSKTLKIKKEKVLLTCFSPFFHIARNRKMAFSIEKINMNLESINKTATELGLQKILADAPTAYDSGMEADSFSADPIFIGRDEDVSEIVETIISRVATHDDERVFSILPIVGMGGLGKTTLTRNVFHHQKMETQFGSRIWVHVSQVFDPINLFNKILKELTSSHSGQGDISRREILKKLNEALKDKTYLLVLDDVSNEDVSKWEDFLNSLRRVTTTKGNGIIVTTRKMDVASFVGTLPIHRLKGLSDEDCWKIMRAKTFGNEDVPLDFESIGREIAKRCGGLPLAASVVGGVLRCDKSVDKWVSIRDDWLPEGEEEDENNITKILRLSFNNLSSPSLKQCFAYCSIFPKGERIEKQKLIEMWMGEGFLGSDDDMESMGDKFYNVLLQSSLLRNYKAHEDDEWCVMQDFMHDLASSVLGNADGVMSRVRYLIHEEGESSPITKEVAKHLRTLIFRADQLSDDTIFSDFKSLHVLTLEVNSLEELPKSVRKLIHLRSLNISETSIRHLPNWIGELHHLQTLRAPTMMEKVPSTVNLRHLHIANAALPAEIGKETGLSDMPSLKEWAEVESDSSSEVMVFPRLQSLRISYCNQLIKVPVHVFSSCLKSLMISYCNQLMTDTYLPLFSELTLLTDLVLEGLNGLESLPDELFYNNPNLSVLKIRRCPKLREIPDGLQTLNSLKSLIIQECLDLEKIRCSTGGRFTSLYELEISECHGLMDIPNKLLESSSAQVLTKVTLKGLSSLKNLPSVIECLANSAGLRELTIVGVPKFMAIN